MADYNEMPEDDDLYSEESLNASAIFIEESIVIIDSSSSLIDEKINTLEDVKKFLVHFSFVFLSDKEKLTHEQFVMIINKILKPLTRLILKVDDLKDSIKIKFKTQPDQLKAYIDGIMERMVKILEISELIQRFTPMED